MRLFKRHSEPGIATVAVLADRVLERDSRIEALGEHMNYLAAHVALLEGREVEWRELAGGLSRDNTAAEARLGQLAGVTLGLPYPASAAIDELRRSNPHTEAPA